MKQKVSQKNKRIEQYIEQVIMATQPIATLNCIRRNEDGSTIARIEFDLCISGDQIVKYRMYGLKLQFIARGLTKSFLAQFEVV